MTCITDLPLGVLDLIVRCLGRPPPRLHAVCRAWRMNPITTAYIKRDLEIETSAAGAGKNAHIQDLECWPRSVSTLHTVRINWAVLLESDQRKQLMRLFKDLSASERGRQLFSGVATINLQGVSTHAASVMVTQPPGRTPGIHHIVSHLLALCPHALRVELPDLRPGDLTGLVPVLGRHPTLASLSLTVYDTVDPAHFPAAAALSRLVQLDLVIGRQFMHRPSQFLHGTPMYLFNIGSLAPLTRLATLSLVMLAHDREPTGFLGISCLAKGCVNLRRLDIQGSLVPIPEDIIELQHEQQEHRRASLVYEDGVSCDGWWPSLARVTFANVETAGAVAAWHFGAAPGLRSLGVPQGLSVLMHEVQLGWLTWEDSAGELEGVMADMAHAAEPPTQLRVENGSTFDMYVTDSEPWGEMPVLPPPSPHGLTRLMSAFSPLHATLTHLHVSGCFLAVPGAVLALGAALPALQDLSIGTANLEVVAALAGGAATLGSLHLHTVELFLLGAATGYSEALCPSILALCTAVQALRAEQWHGLASGQDGPPAVLPVLSIRFVTHRETVAGEVQPAALAWEQAMRARSGQACLTRIACDQLPDW